MTPAFWQFLSQLCGEYSNQTQAFDNPPLFAHIFLRYRPLGHLKPGSILVEQTYAVDPHNPYRLRVIRAEEADNGTIKLWNHIFKEPATFQSATFNDECRRSIEYSDLISMDHCHYQVVYDENGFRGSLEPDSQCIVHRDGKDTLLHSTFSLEGDCLKTLDRGLDLETKERCWGSIAGEFRFQKIQNWASELPLNWRA